MSESWISVRLRRHVATRAGYCCEYCRIREKDTFLGCQVDHIVSEKHGGGTTDDNLAFACTNCNRAKGTDIAARDDAGRIVPLFNPRTDNWRDHFQQTRRHITGLTPTGQATVRLLRLNSVPRLDERS